MSIRRATEIKVSVRDDDPTSALTDALEDVPEGYEIAWISFAKRMIGEGAWQVTVTAKRDEPQEER